MWWDLYYHASLVSPNQLSLMLFIGPGKKQKKLLHALHLTWDQEYILIITFQFKDLHRVILQDNGLDSLKSVGWPMWTNQVTLQTVQSPRTNDVTVLTENTHESDSEHI